MTAALILLIALLVVGGVLYAEHKVYRRTNTALLYIFEPSADGSALS